MPTSNIVEMTITAAELRPGDITSIGTVDHIDAQEGEELSVHFRDPKFPGWKASHSVHPGQPCLIRRKLSNR